MGTLIVLYAWSRRESYWRPTPTCLKACCRCHFLHPLQLGCHYNDHLWGNNDVLGQLADRAELFLAGLEERALLRLLSSNNFVQTSLPLEMLFLWEEGCGHLSICQSYIVHFITSVHPFCFLLESEQCFWEWSKYFLMSPQYHSLIH